jgi:hypothetical protein
MTDERGGPRDPNQEIRFHRGDDGTVFVTQGCSILEGLVFLSIFLSKVLTTLGASRANSVAIVHNIFQTPTRST